MYKKISLILLLLIGAVQSKSQKVDFSVVSVPEESGLEFLQITTSNDNLCLPIVKRGRDYVNWFTNHVIDISSDGKELAYLSWRNNTSNIFIKSIDKQGASVQRTNRSLIQDFKYSPDGRYISFSEKRGNNSQIFQTDAKKGYVCRQITSGSMDFSPVYTNDMRQIIFVRQDGQNLGIWSYDVENNFLSSFSQGMNPAHLNEPNTIICSRTNSEGRSELWRINYENGVEECLVSDVNISFTSPRVSPCGNWLLFVGGSKIITETFTYYNTDIYVARTDGTGLSQLTYHAADDLSPIWSKDGKYIYFVSQRGDADGKANVWRMNFNLDTICE